MPLGLCKIMSFIKGFVPLNLAVITLIMTGTKFVFVCYLKSMPTVDDNFLSTAIYITISGISTVLTIGKMYVSRKSLIIEVSNL